MRLRLGSPDMAQVVGVVDRIGRIQPWRSAGLPTLVGRLRSTCARTDRAVVRQSAPAYRSDLANMIIRPDGRLSVVTGQVDPRAEVGGGRLSRRGPAARRPQPRRGASLDVAIPRVASHAADRPPCARRSDGRPRLRSGHVVDQPDRAAHRGRLTASGGRHACHRGDLPLRPPSRVLVTRTGGSASAKAGTAGGAGADPPRSRSFPWSRGRERGPGADASIDTTVTRPPTSPPSLPPTRPTLRLRRYACVSDLRGVWP